jgi:hypothetical protein
MLDERSRNGRSRGELTFIKKDGSKFPEKYQQIFLKIKMVFMDTFMVIRDISGRKNAEYSFLISFIE